MVGFLARTVSKPSKKLLNSKELNSTMTQQETKEILFLKKSNLVFVFYFSFHNSNESVQQRVHYFSLPENYHCFDSQRVLRFSARSHDAFLRAAG